MTEYTKRPIKKIEYQKCKTKSSFYRSLVPGEKHKTR
ncbi:unnamed protein product [Brassica napus]|uniref:(rape) hypothetical protein n=1 Tax=Brassica napus TaxID=3708 RepID=A0A816JQF6_BRANA|nr:unnamed protein product [Brassica napus]